MGVSKEEIQTKPRPKSVDNVEKKPVRDARDDLIEGLKSDLSKIRKSLTCVVCQDLLFEPYYIECGHVFCYGCLTDWFQQKKDCMQCRAPVLQKPAPAYLIREIIETFVAREELMSPHGTGADLRKQQHEALVRIESDRNSATGLFRGAFERTRRKRILRGVRDPSDMTLRCPECMWEVLDGRCVTCDRNVLDDSAPLGYSDLEEDEDSYEDDSFLDDDMHEGMQIRDQPRRQFIDLTSPPGHGVRDFSLEVVDEEDSESEDEDDTSMADFVVQDDMTSPPRIRGANRRRRRQSSVVSIETTTTTNASVSSPPPQAPRNRRRRVIEGDSDEEEEEIEPDVIASRRNNRRVIPSTSEVDEEDSSEAAGGGGARFGNGRRYIVPSSDNDSEEELLLNTGYQVLDENDTGEGEEESDAPFSPTAPTSSQSRSSASGTTRDRSTPTNNFSSPSIFQTSSPPVRQQAARAYRNVRRRVIQDDDDDDEWRSASSDENTRDREGDHNMNMNMNRAQQGASISRPSTVQRVRNRRGLMSPVQTARRRIAVSSSNDSDGDTTDTTANSTRDNRRTVRTERGAETTFFSNQRQQNARNLSSGRPTPANVDPNIRQLLSSFGQQRQAQEARLSSHPLADLGLSGTISPSRSMTPAGATDREATPTNAPPPNLSSSAPSQHSFSPATMMSSGLASQNSSQNRPNNNALLSPTNGHVNQTATRSTRNQPAHASFSPQLSSAPPRTAPSPGPAGLHFRSPLARVRTSSRTGLRSPGSRNSMRQSTASPIGNVGYGFNSHNPWNPRLLRSSMSPTASSNSGSGTNLLSEHRPPHHRYQSAPAEIPSSPPFMTNHTSESIYAYGANLMQQRERHLRASGSPEATSTMVANAAANANANPNAPAPSRLLSESNPTGLGRRPPTNNGMPNVPNINNNNANNQGFGQTRANTLAGTAANPISISSSPATHQFPYQSFGQALGGQPTSGTGVGSGQQNRGFGAGMGEQGQGGGIFLVGREGS